MKTIKSITLFLGVLALTWSMSLSAAVEDFSFEEETYIDDIPFHTECVTAICHYQEAVAVSFDFEEEAYIDDIPFNTECVTANCRYQKAMKAVFDFEEEGYIDDIPFDTYSFLKTGKCASLASGK